MFFSFGSNVAQMWWKLKKLCLDWRSLLGLASLSGIGRLCWGWVVDFGGGGAFKTCLHCAAWATRMIAPASVFDHNLNWLQ